MTDSVQMAKRVMGLVLGLGLPASLAQAGVVVLGGSASGQSVGELSFVTAGSWTLDPGRGPDLSLGPAAVPAHEPGDSITLSSSDSPVEGPVGGTTRVADLRVQIGADTVVVGGPAPGSSANWGRTWGSTNDTIGVRTGAGSSIFNAGTIQAGSAPGSAPGSASPPPQRVSIGSVDDYTAVLEHPQLGTGQPAFDSSASRAAALATAGAAKQAISAAAAVARDELGALQQRSDAAAAARPEPWIDPASINLDGASAPDNGWGVLSYGSISVNGVTLTNIDFIMRDSVDSVAIDASDDSSIVNAGWISSEQDGIVAGSDNRIINAGRIDAGDDGIKARDRNRIANSGSITAGRYGIDAGDANSIANTGDIDAGNRGISARDDALILNTGSIGADERGVSVGERAVVSNAGSISSDGDGVELGDEGAVLNTGRITAADAAIAAGSSAVIDNRGTLAGDFNAIGAGSGAVVSNTGTVDGGIDLGADGVTVNRGEVTGRIGADVIVNAGRIGGTYSDAGAVLNSGSSSAGLYGDQVLNTGSVTSKGDGLGGGALVNRGEVDAGYSGLKIDGGGFAHNTGSVSGDRIGVSAADADGVGVINAGRISAGDQGEGWGEGRAIDLSDSSGENSVALLSGSRLEGNLAGGSGTDTLILDGSGEEDADISGIERLTMIGEDWSLTGDIQAAEILVASGSLALDGSVAGDVTVYGDAGLAGNGVLSGLMVAAGSVTPGNSIGDLLVEGDAVFNPASRLIIEVGGSEAGLFDTFAASDDIFFNGILDFVFAEDADLDLDDMLLGVLDYDGLLVGPDSDILWSGLPSGWTLNPILRDDRLDIAFDYVAPQLGLAGSAGDLAAGLGQAPVPASMLLIGTGLFGLQMFRLTAPVRTRPTIAAATRRPGPA